MKNMKIVIKPSMKYKIQDDKEMQMFLHMKRKGASTTKNKKQYNRKEKYKTNNVRW